MVRKLLVGITVCFFLAGTAFAQTGSISGTVTDAQSGETLAGANVLISELDRGAPVNAEGQFQISDVPPGTYTLTVSFIGYNEASETVEVAAGEEVVLNFALQPGINLDEVVVTALNREVSERSVSFSTQEVSEEQLNVTQDQNIKTSLAGKISGVQIAGQAGSKLGDFGSIRIRGAISLTNEMAEPLYVVDGVPINNPNIIDMNSVEDINVLKGPNATALYGQRGENGVVIISTKQADRTGVSVELTNSTTFEQVAYLPNFQNTYGKGYSQGEFTTIDMDGTSPVGAPYPDFLSPLDGERYILNGYSDESWGPAFDGESYAPWYSWYPDSPYYGETATWDASPNNVRNFYETGVTSKSGVAVNFNADRYSARVSYTNLNQSGLLPYSSLGKHFVSGRFNYDVTEDFNMGVKVNFTTQEINGEVRSDGYGNQTSGSFNSWFGRQLEIDKIRELQDLETPEGYHASWNQWGPGYMGLGGGYEKPAFWFNPYTWMDRYNENRNTDNLLINADLSYQLNDQFELTGSANTTSETFDFRYELPNSLAFSADQTGEFYNYWVNSFGEMGEEQKEHNFSSRLNYEGNFENWTVDALAGGHVRIQEYNSVSAQMDRTNIQNGGLIIPDVYNFSNSAERMVPVEDNWNKQVLSLFTKATIGYNDYLYFDASFRHDWSSALPSENNGYGYPSFGLSFVFSEFVESDILSYGKLRAGWAQVGNDVEAEAIDQTYQLQQDPFTNPVTQNPATLLLTSSELVDPDIKPALNSSYEVGTDLRFFNDRLGLNVTYYNETREDEIIGASLSAGTGYSSYLTNAGSSEREGVEVSLDATPVVSQQFRWDATINWATNETVVTSLPEGLSSYELGIGSAFDYVALTHRVGEEWGQLRGAGIRRTDDGTPIVNDNGTYAVEQNLYFGSVLPDWTGGILNTFTYKGLSLTTSIDYQKGGQFFTLSEQWGQYSGLLDETASLNDRGVPKRDPVSDGGGVHVTGVDRSGNPVDTYVAAQDYYKQWQDNALAEPFIHDASYVKLREMKLSYSLPQSWIGDYLKSATVGLVGRNLWMIAVSDENENNWDPSELAETYGENGQLPGTRSYGFNVKVTF